MQGLRDAQYGAVTALLDDIGGEPLDDSGFEADEPELGFINSDLAGEE